MSDPAKLLPLTPQMKEKASEQRLDTLLHSGAMMLGATNALTVTAMPFPKLSHALAHYGLGFEIKPLPRGAPTIKPTPFTKLYALPPPLGIIPPEYYGASPTYLGDQFPSLPKSPFLATSTTPERAAVYAAEKQREQLENEVLRFIQITKPEERLVYLEGIRALPAKQRQEGTVLEFQTKILERELAFQKITFTPVEFISSAQAAAIPAQPIAPVLDEFPGAGAPAPVAGPVANGDFHPFLIQPISMLAIASAIAAEGIRRELVTERADP